jgi:aminopeptidase N/puromycin-sensitive aminopeptidase
VYINAGGRGHFRSNYEPAALAKISAEMETTFSPEDRIRLLGDMWAMVRIGRLNIGDYLGTIAKMQGERSRNVVGVMFGRVPEIHDFISSPADRPAFENWVRTSLRPIANDLGDKAVPGESDERRALRSDVFGTLATYGRDPELLAKSRSLVDAYMKDPASVESALAANALGISAMNGDAALYDKYIEHLKTAKTPEEYYNYLGVLGQFPDPALVKRTFEFALSPAVKNQDLLTVFGPLTNPETQATGWELFKSNFKAIMAKADASLGTGFVPAASVFCDAKLRDDSQEFFKAQNIPGTQRILDNAKDTVNACIAMRSFQQANLAAYLKR